MMILTITAVILGSLSPTIGSYYLDVNMCSILYCCISIHTIVLLIALPAFIPLLPHIHILPQGIKIFRLDMLKTSFYPFVRYHVFSLIFWIIYLEFKISIIRSEMRGKLVRENNFWNWIVIYYLITVFSKYSFQTLFNTIIKKIFP